MEPKRILVTGAAGFLGSTLVRELSRKGYDVSGMIHSTPPLEPANRYYKLDLVDRKAIGRFFLWNRFDCVVHCAALSRQAPCEADRKRAFHINVLATRALAEEALAYNTRFVFISTDLVFNGAKGWYVEDDPVHPQSYYAETKSLAEQDVRLVAPVYLILRVALMYGIHGTGPGGFLEWTIDTMRKGEALKLYINQYRTILRAEEVATAIDRLLACGAKNQTYHVAGPVRLNRFEAGKRVAAVFQYPDAEIIPALLRRPIELGETDDIALVTEKIRRETGITFSSVDEGLKKTYRQLTVHRS